MEFFKEKVLIIDDSNFNIKILSDILDTDYDVIIADSGIKGLDLIYKELPSLILLDVIMPEMDGYEVCKKIKEDPLIKDIPVIFVTSLVEMDNEEKGLKLGAIDYITKPFNAPIVKIRVKNQLELKRHRDLLEKLSSLDGLTGIPNRRQFDKFLDQEWHNSLYTQLPIALIILDIDYFKLYNDNYGHLLGDETIKQVASILNNSKKRTTDLVARYGGEEFACILPNTSISEALDVANCLKNNVENLAIPHAYSKVSDYITVSLGVHSCIPEVGLSPDTLIKIVDKLLYDAKKDGRNRICSA